MAMKKNPARGGSASGGKITIVGCGPGSADYLTPVARNEINRAEVLFGAARLLQAFAPGRARRIVVGADIDATLEQIALWRHRRHRVVVLVTGDPGLCSLAQPIIRRFGREACRVIPGISSLQAAFAAIGLDWLEARIVSAHRSIPLVAPAELTRESKIAILTGNNAARPWLRKLVSKLGGGYRIFVCQNLTLPQQSVRLIRPAQLLKLDLAGRNVILFIRPEELR